MRLITATLLATIAFSGMAYSATPPDDLLSGPTLQKEEVTSKDMASRKMEEEGKLVTLSRKKQQRAWMLVLRTLELTEEQQLKVRSLFEKLQKEQKEFQATHGKEIRSIREAHDKDKNGKRDLVTTILIGAPKDQAAIPEATKKRLIELMGNAPDVTTYQEKAWIFLTVEQQKIFRVNYQKHLEEEAKRREDMQDKDRPNKDRKDRRVDSEDSPRKGKGKRPSNKEN